MVIADEVMSTSSKEEEDGNLSEGRAQSYELDDMVRKSLSLSLSW